MKYSTRLLLSATAIVFFLALRSPVHADTCTVTSPANDGTGSLREKLADTSCDTIDFAGDATIALSSELVVNRNVTIDGTGHDVTVSGNHTTRVFNITAGDVTIDHLTITDGSVQTYDCGGIGARCGGGIMMQNVAVTLRNSTVSGNSAPDYGGGIYALGTLNVVNSQISGNSAYYNWAVQCPNYGGGLYNEGGTANVTNTTFSGNTSDCGGAIFNEMGAILNVTNSTISGNSAAYGGGLMNWGDAPVTVTNSILWGAGGGGDIVNWAWASGPLTVNHTIVGSAYAYNGYPAYTGTGNRTVDPLLAPFADYGGRTQTYALRPGSAAVGAGDSATCAAAPVNGLDQRGVSRPAGESCDMGAYEIAAATVVLGASGEDVVLKWPYVLSGLSYTAWRSAEPYFTATGDPNVACTVGAAEVTCTDAGASCEPESNCYYVLRATLDAGSVDANRLGIFGFELQN